MKERKNTRGSMTMNRKEMEVKRKTWINIRWVMANRNSNIIIINHFKLAHANTLPLSGRRKKIKRGTVLHLHSGFVWVFVFGMGALKEMRSRQYVYILFERL